MNPLAAAKFNLAIKRQIKVALKTILHLSLLVLLVGCGSQGRLLAEDRLFLNLNLEFLDAYDLPKQTFQNTPVGGLSAIAYDRKRDRYYAVSDDRSRNAPARFYTLAINLKQPGYNLATEKVKISSIKVEDVTFIKNEQGELYPPNTTDTEGIALSPRNSVFISSEGIPHLGIAPFIKEFDQKTGILQQTLPLPQRYFPDPDAKQPKGMSENLGFESLTIFPQQGLSSDPFRLFAAIEGALQQDSDRLPNGGTPLRLLHYGINPIGPPVLIAEHLYLLEPAPTGAVKSGLSDLLALDREGYWLSLERHLGLLGYQAKIFQVITAGGTDTSSILAMQNNLSTIVPVQKRLLLDLDTLGIELENLEGMTLGPRLADGSQTLVIISDDNFSADQKTQVLLFKLRDRKLTRIF